VAGASKAQSILGWTAKHNLTIIVSTAWAWMLQKFRWLMAGFALFTTRR
jgi:UDP-glucose 4-epimerase